MREIYLDDITYQPLLLERCTPFVFVELLRPCERFKEGIFHGSVLSTKQEGYQEMTIHNIYNLFQFSQIVEDEVVVQHDIPYLDSKFFLRRSEAVREVHNTDKIISNDGNNVNSNNTIVGYCINGISYHRDDRASVVQYFAHQIYYPLICKKKEWENLKLAVNYITNNNITTNNDTIQSTEEYELTFKTAKSNLSSSNNFLIELLDILLKVVV